MQPSSFQSWLFFTRQRQKDTEESVQNNPQILLNVIKKQAKLAFITYGTTFVLFGVLANMLSQQGLQSIVQSFGYIDTIINGLCIFCTFDFELNKRCYRYLCDCNGVKPLQMLFCLCCYCCSIHQDKTKTNEAKLDTVVNKGNNNKSETVTATDNSVEIVCSQ